MLSYWLHYPFLFVRTFCTDKQYKKTQKEGAQNGRRSSRACRFSEWLEFEYGNYYYVFYHAKRWDDDKITYRKRYFNAFKGKQCGPIIIGDLYSGTIEARAV